MVIDRLAVNEKDRGRLVDSIGQAYEMSIKYNEQTKGLVTVISTENEINISVKVFHVQNAMQSFLFQIPCFLVSTLPLEPVIIAMVLVTAWTLMRPK